MTQTTETTQTIQIKCISKTDRPNPWERIQYVGGVNPNGARWKLSQQAAIDGVESGRWKFWVAGEPASVWVEVAESRFGNKYLKTQPDGQKADNLLSLPECP